ncbi:hypothetical protein [Mycolicibacterium sp.]|uniref:hypothetical protein n=1 Tax=Mycolicibacterium sp. TaxID=2320850 RepID=UPI0037CB8E64
MPDDTSHSLFPGQTGNRANYRGDVAHSVMTRREPFGPDLYGAKYAPVEAKYDAEADLTRVQFRPIPKAERGQGEPLPGELPPLTRQQRRQFEREIRKAHARKTKPRKEN